MSVGQSGVSTVVVAVILVALVVLLGVGGAAVAKVAPFAGSSTSSSGNAAPTALAKPSDPKQAVLDAIGRTANFKDIKYDSASVSINSQQTITSSGTISATKDPLIIDTKILQISGANKTSENIQNGPAKLFCINVAGSPPQKVPSQINLTADAADPFNTIKTKGTDWKYLDDVDLNGHKDWHVMGNNPIEVGVNSPLKIQLSTADVFIDSRSGKIEKFMTQVKESDATMSYDFTSTDTNFVYDAGVTITPCQ